MKTVDLTFSASSGNHISSLPVPPHQAAHNKICFCIIFSSNSSRSWFVGGRCANFSVFHYSFFLFDFQISATAFDHRRRSRCHPWPPAVEIDPAVRLLCREDWLVHNQHLWMQWNNTNIYGTARNEESFLFEWWKEEICWGNSYDSSELLLNWIFNLIAEQKKHRYYS